MKVITKYFPDLSDVQKEQFSQLDPLYRQWNAMINVISRKDIENLFLHHILHSLSLAKFISFKADSKILDLGTGGGFPGIPLAILFPEVHFHLVDSIGKKLKVVQDISEQINLNNISVQHIRVEDMKDKKFDFVVTRAVAPCLELFRWSRKHLSKTNRNVIPNGIIALKGGNIFKELKELPKGEYREVTPINTYFTEDYFKEKYIVYIQG